jgi:[ribosomal protein S18]-alanine N-acetyltransferase
MKMVHQGPAFALRPAHMSDVDALLALERELFATHRISRRSFRRFLASPTATLIVLERDGRPAGYALVLYRANSNLARLYSIGVASHHRGRGLARRLLSAAQLDARGRLCRAMRLEVREDDARAIAFYQKAGYRLFGRRAGYYRKRTDALLFEKPLSSATGGGRGPKPAKRSDSRARIGFDSGHRAGRSRHSVRSQI